MLISSGVLIIRCDDTHIATAANANTMRDMLLPLLLLIRRRCSISKSFISSAYNAATTTANVTANATANANARSRDAAMLIMLLVLMRDLEMLLLLIRRRCSIAYYATTTNATVRDLEMLIIKCDDAYNAAATMQQWY